MKNNIEKQPFKKVSILISQKSKGRLQLVTSANPSRYFTLSIAQKRF